MQGATQFPNPLDPETEDRIDKEAWKRARGDIALYVHHRSLLIGEFDIYRRGPEARAFHARTLHLSQYRAVEKSVIKGWREFVKNSYGIPPKEQGKAYAVDRAIVFDALRRKPNEQAEVLKRMAKTFHAAAENGDVRFFRTIGRLMSQDTQGILWLRRFDYAYGILSRWLTDYYWLMPAKLVSYRVSLGLGVKDNLRSFLATKSRYGLRSHQPALIQHFERIAHNTEASVLTPRGKRLLLR